MASDSWIVSVSAPVPSWRLVWFDGRHSSGQKAKDGMMDEEASIFPSIHHMSKARGAQINGWRSAQGTAAWSTTPSASPAAVDGKRYPSRVLNACAEPWPGEARNWSWGRRSTSTRHTSPQLAPHMYGSLTCDVSALSLYGSGKVLHRTHTNTCASYRDRIESSPDHTCRLDTSSSEEWTCPDASLSDTAHRHYLTPHLQGFDRTMLASASDGFGSSAVDCMAGE